MNQLKMRWQWLIRACVLAMVTGTLSCQVRDSGLSRVEQIPEDFWEAIRAEDADAVEGYLQQGIDPNMMLCGSEVDVANGMPNTTADCQTISHPLLHQLITWPNTADPEIIDVLIEYGADVNGQNMKGETLLHVLAGRLPIPEEWVSKVGTTLIAHGTDVNLRDQQGRTALEIALCSETPSNRLVAQLVDSGVDIEAMNRQSICDATLLHLAAKTNNPALAEVALAQGIAINVSNDKGQTPLHYLRGAAVGELLIAQGADLNARDTAGHTPLEAAICLHSGWTPLKSEVIAFLLASGANRQPIPLDVGCGPLLAQAIGSDSVELVEVAIANGSDITVKDQAGQTALHLAGRFNATDVAAFLILQGSNINAVDDQGYTPLHMAAIHRNLEVAQVLLDQGANIKALDEDGHTPLYEAQNPFWDANLQDLDLETTQALVNLLQQFESAL
ncbi:MAG: ankyrin repeat domain-containing protein [Cyanobacteria bacterium P01_F01_bin.86]